MGTEKTSTSQDGVPLTLEMRGVSKAFGATQALDGVGLKVPRGQVHALIGENGAGKSTLMKILSGALKPDAGEVLVDGRKLAPGDPQAALRAGIAMIYQELNLAPDLDAVENVLLGAEPHLFGWIRRRKRNVLVNGAFEKLRRHDIPLDLPVGKLSIGQQQLIEIARALVHQPRVMILDEPTSSLPDADAQRLFSAIRGLRDDGVSIVYISHFLEECQEICETFTVLRDGKTVGSGAMNNTDLKEIIRLMVGRELESGYPHRTDSLVGEPRLELSDIDGDPMPEKLSCRVREGEIFGLAGLIGAGRTETLRTIFGLDRCRGGAVIVDGAILVKRNPGRMLKAGVGMVSEDRKEEGLLLNRSIADNLTLTKLKPLSRAGFISRNHQRSSSMRWMRKLKVKAEDPAQPAGALSGGNQQKVALGRLLHHEASVFLLDEPTRGIDVGSKAEIYALMRELANEGKTVVFVSSYLPELLGVCDTIGVMCRGRMSKIAPFDEWTEHTLMEQAVGHIETV